MGTTLESLGRILACLWAHHELLKRYLVLIVVWVSWWPLGSHDCCLSTSLDRLDFNRVGVGTTASVRVQVHRRHVVEGGDGKAHDVVLVRHLSSVRARWIHLIVVVDLVH